jgi:hypothetical protein
MKVRFRQTGGFGGLVLGCDLDTTALSQSDGSLLTRLVEKAKLREIGVRKDERGRDLTNYEIVVEDAGDTVRATVDDMTVSPQIEPLLEFLRARARAIPLGK